MSAHPTVLHTNKEYGMIIFCPPTKKKQKSITFRKDTNGVTTENF